MGKMSTVNLDISIKNIDTMMTDFMSAISKIENDPKYVKPQATVANPGAISAKVVDTAAQDAAKEKLRNQYKVFQRDCYPLKAYLGDLKTAISNSIDTLTDAKKLVKKQVLTGSREDKITTLTKELEDRISELNSLLKSVSNFLEKLNILPEAPMVTIRAAK